MPRLSGAKHLYRCYQIVSLDFLESRRDGETKLEPLIPFLSTAMHWMNIILQKKEDFDRSEGQYQASLCISQDIHGEDAAHPDIAVVLHQLGTILELKEDFRSQSTARVSTRIGASLAQMLFLHAATAGQDSARECRFRGSRSFVLRVRIHTRIIFIVWIR